MLQLNDDNYYTAEANNAYWSSSLFKAFERCPAKALAEISGEYERETSTSLLVGSYVDAYFTGDKGALGKFALEHPEIFKKDGSLKSDFRHAETMINAVKAQPLMMDYLKGDHQAIMTANLFDVDWKIKMDVFDGKRIVPRCGNDDGIDYAHVNFDLQDDFVPFIGFHRVDARIFRLSV